MLLYILSAVVVLICLPETLTRKKLVAVDSMQSLRVNFVLHYSNNHRSVNSSLTENEEFNGEAVAEGHCPLHECTEGFGEDQSSRLCSSDSSVEPSGLCDLLLIQACLQGIHSLSSHCAALSNICLVKKC